MELLERDRERETLETAIEESSSRGVVVVVEGEAGIGKTALVSSIALTHRVLWGACDPLITPRPMGPLRDVAREAGGPLAEAVEGSRDDLLSAVLDELRAPAALVIEDLHWADDATLDFVALLGRRLPRSRGCLIVTCRPEQRPEVRRVLGALPRERVRQLEPGALSEGAVALLAERAGREASDLHAVSGGNPFFVTEVLAAPAGASVPASVRDALALRLASIGPRAREVAELAAIVPGPAELRLVDDALGARPEAIDECVVAGLLQLRGEALAFRHDLARRAVEDALSPLRRRELNRRGARRARGGGGARPGPPRPPRAPRRRRGRRSGGSPRRRRARRPPRAATARRSPTGRPRSRRPAGRTRRRWRASRSRRTWARAWTARSRRAARCSSSTTPQATRCARATTSAGSHGSCGGPGTGRRRRQPPTARSRGSRRSRTAASWRWRSAARSQLAMLSERHEEAIELGTRAERLARRIGDRETVAHALTNVGTTILSRAIERGRAMLEEAFVIAIEAGYDDHAARALVNLATAMVTRRPDDARVADGRRARAAVRARARARRLRPVPARHAREPAPAARRWDAAEADARASLASASTSASACARR